MYNLNRQLGLHYNEDTIESGVDPRLDLGTEEGFSKTVKTPLVFIMFIEVKSGAIHSRLRA